MVEETGFADLAAIASAWLLEAMVVTSPPRRVPSSVSGGSGLVLGTPYRYNGCIAPISVESGGLAHRVGRARVGR
jgi:hypothetical protein